MQAVTWVLLFLMIAVVILAPRFGLLAAIARRGKALAREQTEDALKFLLEAQEQGARPSQEALRTGLRLSPGRASALLRELRASGLIDRRGASIRLTGAGERWALQVVRAHRLWERFLADEARMPLGNLHAEAHQREHHLSPAQADELEAAMGFPTLDPHGDPIPSRRGSLPRTTLAPITSLPLRKTARIEHLEDEPAMAFQQILAAGLRVGQTIRVLERSSNRLILTDGTQEISLALAVAANIHVSEQVPARKVEPAVVRLSDIAKGTGAEIVSLDKSVQGFTRRRFLDLGLTPGTTILPELDNFFGDPRGYRVRGTLIALRRDQAEGIWVKPARGRARGRAGHPRTGRGG